MIRLVFAAGVSYLVTGALVAAQGCSTGACDVQPEYPAERKLTSGFVVSTSWDDPRGETAPVQPKNSVIELAGDSLKINYEQADERYQVIYTVHPAR